MTELAIAHKDRAHSAIGGRNGSRIGIGISTRQAKWKPVLGILLSWLVTLPCAATLAAAAFWILPRLGFASS